MSRPFNLPYLTFVQQLSLSLSLSLQYTKSTTFVFGGSCVVLVLTWAVFLWVFSNTRDEVGGDGAVDLDEVLHRIPFQFKSKEDCETSLRYASIAFPATHHTVCFHCIPCYSSHKLGIVCSTESSFVWLCLSYGVEHNSTVYTSKILLFFSPLATSFACFY